MHVAGVPTPSIGSSRSPPSHTPHTITSVLHAIFNRTFPVFHWTALVPLPILLLLLLLLYYYYYYYYYCYCYSTAATTTTTTIVAAATVATYYSNFSTQLLCRYIQFSLKNLKCKHILFIGQTSAFVYAAQYSTSSQWLTKIFICTFCECTVHWWPPYEHNFLCLFQTKFHHSVHTVSSWLQ